MVKMAVQSLSVLTVVSWMIMLLAASGSETSLRAAASERELVTKVNFCRVGYIMDTFCIQLGTLLDKPQLQSLRYPDQHSLHCVVEIQTCVLSGYEILSAPASSGKDYGRLVKLDARGNTLALNLARKTGSCSSCSGTLVQGFRATVVGYLANNKYAADGTPPYLNVTQVLPASVGCSKYRPTARPTVRVPTKPRKPTPKPSIKRPV